MNGVAWLSIQLKINPPAFASQVLLSQVFAGMPADSVSYLAGRHIFFFLKQGEMALETFAGVLYRAFKFFFLKKVLSHACVWVARVCPVL